MYIYVCIHNVIIIYIHFTITRFYLSAGGRSDQPKLTNMQLGIFVSVLSLIYVTVLSKVSPPMVPPLFMYSVLTYSKYFLASVIKA